MPRFARMGVTNYRLSVGLPRCLLIVACLIVATDVPAAGGDGVAKMTETKVISFGIPSQPLDEALTNFSKASGVQVFYESSLTQGHRSSEVNGQFDPQTALRLMLLGSGLIAKMIAANTVSIARPRAASVPDAAELKAKRAFVPYYGLLQTEIMRALCASDATRPGDYRIALQYSLNPAGQIKYLKLIGSSGSSQRDGAIVDALRNVTLPPPGDMPQPVTIAIERIPPGVSGCFSPEPEPSQAR